jgi:phytanoyl-CoA hydroxylase
MDAERRRQGDRYEVTEEERARFHADGYVHLHGILSEQELAEIESVYARFLAGEIEVPGKDLCDMTGEYGSPIEEFRLINVMLPRRYWPAWRGNLYERRAASIAEQLIGDGLELDYDQLLAKPPGESEAIFHWHQDMAYWIDTPDPRTASFWLALDESSEENGCMRFIPGTHLEPELRQHGPLTGDRDESHTLLTELREGDEVKLAQIARGDCTVHHQRVLHGSGGNTSERWRRAYIVAYRSAETVAEERLRGFTHSHNDEPEVLGSVESMKPVD